MRKPRTVGSAIAYTPSPDATPGAELNALAAVYKFVLDCRAKREGGADDRPTASTVAPRRAMRR